MDAVVGIVAIVFGYKLLSEWISSRKEVKIVRYRSKDEAHTYRSKDEAHTVVQESPGELQARADQLLRRLATLEEIIASEKEGLT